MLAFEERKIRRSRFLRAVATAFVATFTASALCLKLLDSRSALRQIVTSFLSHHHQSDFDADSSIVYGQPVRRELRASDGGARDVYSEEPDCVSCTTCRGVPAPSVCGDGVPDFTVPDPAAAYDPKPAQDWFEGITCPFPRSMWVISTLTPGHPREAWIVDRMRQLTAHSTWGVLFVSTQQGPQSDDDGNPPPIINILGRNIAVMNLSLATLKALPLESSKALVRLLRDRAKGEWGRKEGQDPMLTSLDRLHMSLKMIPYLVAIKCNARAIFDTVDDELPNYLPGLLKANPDMVTGPFRPQERQYYALPPQLPEPPIEEVPTWPVLVTPRADVSPMINPYASLGNRIIHPRGFPTELVYNTSFQVLHIHRQMEPMRPLVQQWVPHAHPDLSFTDISELRTHNLPKLMKDGPPVLLDQWAWAPYNARGTLFLPGAYWAMFLSPSQSNQFTDVLRSYWSLRLLWDTGATVGYKSTTSPAPNPGFCNTNFGFHQERLDGGCEGPFLFRDVARSRKQRQYLLQEDLRFQTQAVPLINFLDAWQYEEPGSTDTPQFAGLPPPFIKALTLMCNLGESSQLANCKDCFALRAWLRDLTAARYKPPVYGVAAAAGASVEDAEAAAQPLGTKTPQEAVFPLQRPDRSVLSFGGDYDFSHNLDTLYTAPQPGDKQLELAVCLSGLADRIDVRLNPEEYWLPGFKRAQLSDQLLLDYNLRQMAPPFGGMTKIHHFYVMGSYNTVESNLHLLLQGKLPFVAVVVHRDWVLEPLLPPDEQCQMERYNATWVQLKWTNEARHYQRSQLHQVWEEDKCFELASRFMHRYHLRYRSFMRHRSDFNVTQFPGENAHLIPQWTAAPEWKDTVYIPRGKDWRGINDRIALGGWRAMSDYFFRWYDMRRRLWETGWEDYNHLWAEPFLNFTLRSKGYTVVREPQVLNYTEFNEIPKPRTYVGDDATRRRLSAAASGSVATGSAGVDAGKGVRNSNSGNDGATQATTAEFRLAPGASSSISNRGSAGAAAAAISELGSSVDDVAAAGATTTIATPFEGGTPPYGPADASALARRLREQQEELEALRRQLALLQHSGVGNTFSPAGRQRPSSFSSSNSAIEGLGRPGLGAAVGATGETMDVLEEAQYDPQTGHRVPLMA